MAKISIIPWIVKKLKRCIGIVEDNDTASQAIASNKYVIWKGDICKSTSAISEGDTLSSSNLSAVNDGIGNDLSQAIAKLNSNLSSLKIWVGTITFSFNNSYYTSVPLSTATGGIVNDTNIKAASLIAIGQDLSYALPTNKQTIVAYKYGHQSATETVDVLAVLYYS